MALGPIVLTFAAVPLYLLIVALKIWLLLPLLYGWNFPLSQIPGPKAASWTRLWWVKTLFFNHTAEELVRLHAQYGPLVRIGPNNVLVSDPETTRRILAVGSNFERGPWFDSLRLSPAITNVISETDSKKHQQLRSILSGGLSEKDVIDMESIIDEHIHEWTCLLDGKCTLAGPTAIELDLSQSVRFLTLDIITHLGLGESFQCIIDETDHYGFLGALQHGMIFQQYIAFLPKVKSLLSIFARLPYLKNRLFPNAKNPSGIGRVMGVIRKAVERRLVERRNGIFKKDMLDSFLSRGLTIDQATNELVVVLSSGVGATSYAVQGIVRSIVADQRVCRTLQSEIDEVMAKRDNMSYNRPLRQVEDAVINQMKYLQACICEGLRMYPPIFQLRERVVPSVGDVVEGYFIPGGTFVGFNSLANQFHPTYGDHPEQFYPERWLIDDGPKLKQMHRNLELVFGYGSSKCLGINLANIELNKIIFELFKNYELSFVRPGHPWTSRGDFVLSNFRVRLKRRLAQSYLRYISEGI